MTAAQPRIDVIVLAGGRGTRLQSVVADVPKPLALVNGRPFLDYQFSLLEQAPAVGRVILAIGHLADRVIDHYSAHKPLLDLDFAIETQPLGTAGALRNALSLTSSAQILALNGDSIFRWDIGVMREVHCATLAQATVALLEIDDVSRYGAVTVEQNRVMSFLEKTPVSRPGLINAGVYLFERPVIEAIPADRMVSLEHETLPNLARNGTLSAAIFRSKFIDIGLPETYERAAVEVPRLFEEH